MSNLENTILVDLARKLFRGCTNFHIEPDSVKLMTWSWQELFVDLTLRSPVIKKYPISTELSRIFLKKLINCIEPVQEVHDNLYAELCRAMNNSAIEDYCYRHYVISNDLNNIITMKETKNMVVNGTTGMRTWEAALMLSDWILCNKELFSSKDVLELGSGIGFTGITLAKFCEPKSVTMTDCHEDVLQVLCENVDINFPSQCKNRSSDGTTYELDNVSRVDVKMLDWNEITDLPNKRPDVILGADIVYDPSILKPLCNVLKIFCDRKNDVNIYIASIIRNELTFESFLQVLETYNFHCEKLMQPTNAHIEWDHTHINRCLLKIMRK
ncbi:protein-lysine N-methyltransferase EEF2KMT isoform X1 [Bombyx mori]|uniref:FAM86 N-terminal domain-containing protein n=1 Tax=Bombyx mori TaxID=7091 RepID=A0A8R1WQ45_BOMMO|nr:protein-lysine N-methyltransferase EEF2KMT isoform X1 [Bombyx mori]